MSGYKSEQCRLLYRGREFHFVSYDAQPAVRQEAAVPAMWCLMASGKRWLAIPQIHDGDAAALEAALQQWLDAEVFAGVPVVAPRSRNRGGPSAATKRR